MSSDESDPTIHFLETVVPARRITAPPVCREIEAYGEHLAQLLATNLQLPPTPVNALDFACGDGQTTLALYSKLPPGSRVVATHDHRAELRPFHQRLSTSQRQYIFPRRERADRLPFAAGVFDVAWAALPARQLDPLRSCLRQVLRTLRPGGLLLLAVPLRTTFVELVRSIGNSLSPHRSHEGFSPLMSQPANLLLPDDWLTTLPRCGAKDPGIMQASFAVRLEPPLSERPFFTRILLPLWLPDNPAAQASTIRMLDEEISAPIETTIHTACVRASRGAELLEDIATT